MTEYHQWDASDVSDLADWVSTHLSDAAHRDVSDCIEAKVVAKAIAEVDWNEVAEAILEAAISSDPVSD